MFSKCYFRLFQTLLKKNLKFKNSFFLSFYRNTFNCSFKNTSAKTLKNLPEQFIQRFLQRIFIDFSEISTLGFFQKIIRDSSKCFPDVFSLNTTKDSSSSLEIPLDILLGSRNYSFFLNVNPEILT